MQAQQMVVVFAYFAFLSFLDGWKIKTFFNLDSDVSVHTFVCREALLEVLKRKSSFSNEKGEF